MKIIFNNNLTFGQLVSTPLLLKAGSGKIKFEDAKILNNEIGQKYSGHISFITRARNIASNAAKKDEKLTEIFEKLKNVPSNQLENEINSYTAKLGEKIDINI